MTLHKPGLLAAAAFAFYALALPRADAACSDKRILAMAQEGRPEKAIAKTCGMPAARVRGVIESGGEAAGPELAERQAEQQARQEEAARKLLPPGSGLARCDCQGSVPYGDKAPERRCRSGTSIATPCPGYCPPNGIAPWRRICS